MLSERTIDVVLALRVLIEKVRRRKCEEVSWNPISSKLENRNRFYVMLVE